MFVEKGQKGQWSGNNWANWAIIGHYVQCQVVRKGVRLISSMERVRNVFPHYSPNPQNGDMGIPILSEESI